MRQSSVNVRSVIAGLCVGLACVSAAWGDPPTQDGLKMRGLGATRQALDAMQLKMFDSGNWAHLKDWQGEFKPEATGGKVVMIVTWAAWRAPSHGAMKIAQEIATKHKSEDLIVVGVHNPRGFEQAASNAKDLGVTFAYAADPEGKFRSAIKADADPNFYFLDRAGQLRFAQVEASSAGAAAEKLLAETSEQAKAITGNIAAAKAAAEKERFKTGGGGAGPIVAPSAKVEFQQPDDEAYKKVKWPYLIGSLEEDKILNKIYDKPPKLQVGEENWLPSKPDWSGKLLLLYIVDPLDATMCNVLPVMNAHAIKHQADVVVVGSALKLGTDETVSGDELQKLIRRNTSAIQGLMAAGRLNHPMWAERAKAENTDNLGFRHTSGFADFAYAVITSTDGKIRWVGNPYNRELVNKAIEALLEVDPGVAARRKAEALAKSGGGKKSDE